MPAPEGVQGVGAPLYASSCDIPEPGPRPGRILMRFDPATFTWEGVPPQAYKPIRGTDLAWEGVTRHTLIGSAGEPARFHLRYFEVAPGGYSSLERHRHVHAVVVVRGRGVVRVGAERYEVRPLDVVYVPPGTPHQFLNPDPQEPFGFFCPVDAERDAPQPAARDV